MLILKTIRRNADAMRVVTRLFDALTLLAALTLFVSISVKASFADDLSYENSLTPHLKSHCTRCHGEGDSVEGDVDLTSLSHERLRDDPELIQSLIDVLELEEMPPEGEPDLDSDLRAGMVTSLKTLREYAASQRHAMSHTPIRRLNRFQYNNAVVDLLELNLDLFALPERMLRDHSRYFDPASGTMPPVVKVGSRPLGKSQLVQQRLSGVAPFPQDLRAEHGFDNRGDHLSLSPLLMESFLKLSRSIVGSRDFGPKSCGIWNSLFAKPDDDSDVHQVVRERLRTFLTRAFRRPIHEKDLGSYVRAVLLQIDSGKSFADGMKLAVSATLASPRFLYLYDRGGKAAIESIGDFELASRLSFFLWGSIPDQELLDLATRRRLREPDVLDQQLTRMLNDPKMKRFCDSFPSQWLQLEQIISAKPDPDRFPGFYRGQYRASMHMMVEPLLLFETVLVENRSILDLIDPDFSYRSDLLNTWINAGDAGNFRPNVLTFKRVQNDDRREGGVITNPAVMTMNASPDRSKPITRGAWIASVIFNDPPKPPPADVPPLPESGEDDSAQLTLRERLSLHRKRADCRGCHEKIDPLGFALENYGPTGVWREKYDNGRAVDSSGVLFRKHAFENPIEFKDAILKEKDRFTRALSEHILSFALGRQIHATDATSVDEIVRETIADHYKLRTLIRQVVLSDLFLQKFNPKSGQRK